MSTKIALVSGKIGLVAGLDWQVLTRVAGKRDGRQAELRDHAKAVGAKKLCVVSQETQASVGLYLDDDERPQGVKQLHSLAAAVAVQVKVTENLILAWTLGKDCALVIVEGGVPVVDQVKPLDVVKSTVGMYLRGEHGGVSDYGFITNDLEEFSAIHAQEAGRGRQVSAVTAEQVVAGVAAAKALNQSTALVSPPADLKKLLKVGLIGAAVLGAYFGWSLYSEHAAREEQRRRQAAEDPLPKYQAELQRGLMSMGIERRSLAALYERLLETPVWLDGWELARIFCQKDGSCKATWMRRGGTTAALLAANPGKELAPDSKTDEVYLQWMEQLVLGGLQSPDQIPRGAAEQTKALSILQAWSNANVVLNGSLTPIVWPQVPGLNMAALPPSATVKVTPIDITAPGAVTTEVILTAPASVWWTELTVEVQIQTAQTSVKGNLKGNLYGL